MTLATIDPTSAIAVTSYLEKAREWVETAVENTTTLEIAKAKAEIATAAEAAKQLNLSRDIRDDSVELVRRFEYALGKSIRKGQAEGIIADHGGARRSTTATPTLKSPSEFASKQELSGAGHQQPGIYALADDIEPEEFDQALDAARAEGNLSRANVARKAAEITGKVRKLPRRPLNESARHAALNLISSVERIQSVIDDDRFTREAEQVAPPLRNHLTNAIETLTGLLERIHN